MPRPQVIFPADLNPYPEEHEVTAAALLAKHFNVNLTFVLRTNYQTPDFLISTVFWELKSPTGHGKRTIEHNVRAALTQAGNIVFDCRRCKIDQRKIARELQLPFTKIRKIQHLVMITKTSEV